MFHCRTNVHQIEAFVDNPLKSKTVHLKVFVVQEVCSIPEIKTSLSVHTTVR